SLESSQTSHAISTENNRLHAHIQEIGLVGDLVIFSKSSCCMCHAIKRLFYEQGVNPMIYELDKEINGREMEHALIYSCT
ncbi:monothiol glutaredoxin-S10-like, partial [Olea europaea subsp. europaea]